MSVLSILPGEVCALPVSVSLLVHSLIYCGPYLPGDNFNRHNSDPAKGDPIPWELASGQADRWLSVQQEIC